MTILTRSRTSSLTIPLATLAALALSVHTPAARASPRDDEPPALAPRVERLDTAPHELWTPARSAPLWVALQVGAADLASGERAFTAMLLAGIPLERLHPAGARPALADPAGSAATPAPAGQAPVEAPRLKPPRAARTRGTSPEPQPPSTDPPRDAAAPRDSAPELLPVPVRVTPAIARAAVRAALRSARLVDPETRVDALASRARTSALLPELRLRVSRLVDEAESLSPTQYDPERTTATGGTSLWLEARATWQLDRLVFAGEEVALERLRRERAQAQEKLAARVLELLFAWQRAVALEADPALEPDKHRAATLAVAEAEASLDIVTDGWFTRFRATDLKEVP